MENVKEFAPVPNYRQLTGNSYRNGFGYAAVGLNHGASDSILALSNSEGT